MRLLFFLLGGIFAVRYALRGVKGFISLCIFLFKIFVRNCILFLDFSFLLCYNSNNYYSKRPSYALFQKKQDFIRRKK